MQEKLIRLLVYIKNIDTFVFLYIIFNFDPTYKML